MQGYKGNLKDGREIYIPYWPVDVSLENLGKAGKFLGVENLIRISTPDIPAVILALTTTEDAGSTAALIRHFVCEARVDGDRITSANYDTHYKGNLVLVAEVFSLVVHAQYSDFFVSGLAKENSPES